MRWPRLARLAPRLVRSWQAEQWHGAMSCSGSEAGELAATQTGDAWSHWPPWRHARKISRTLRSAEIGILIVDLGEPMTDTANHLVYRHVQLAGTLCSWSGGRGHRAGETFTAY